MKAETKKTPTLRFPEFTNEWKEKKYGDIFSFRTTNSFSRENLNYENGEVKNIHYGDIHTKFKTLFDITNEYVPFINEDIELSKISDDNYCKVGDLVIADASEDYADVGKCIEIINLNDENVLAGLHTFLARPDLYEMKSGFSGYLMQSKKVRLQVMTIAQGTKVLGIAKGRLEKIKLNIPENKEQEKIASFLTSIDKKIEKLTKKKDLLEKYKKGVMQKIFNQEIRFKDENGEDFADWEVKKLGNISDVRDGTHDSPKYIEKGHPFITSKNLLKDGSVDFDNVSYISSEDYINYNRRSGVNIGDILFGMIGTIGNPVLLENEGFAIKNVALIKEKNDLKNNYLIHYLNSHKILKQFHFQNAGGTQKFIALGLIRKLKIELPSLREQNKIADFLSAIDDKINLVNRELEKTKEYKKGLLQQMFV